MSDRGLAPAFESAADSGNIRLIIFTKLEFDSGTIYLHNGVGVYNFGGNDYLGIGDFGGISGITESTELSPYEINLVLSGLDTDMFDEILNQQYYLRPVTIYMGALDIDAGTMLADPDEIWIGTMDTATITLGEENNLIVTCESDFAMFERTNGAVFSDSDLQGRYPGDLFLKWLNAMEDVVIRWGASNVGTGVVDPNPDPHINTP